MAASLLSCAKEILDPEKEKTQNEDIPMTFNVTILETKATKTEWAEGDKIYVFFNGLETKYLVLTYDGTEWTNTSGGGTLLNTDFNGLNTRTLTAVHFPVAVDVAYADSKFSFSSGGKRVYNYYLSEIGKTYTVDGTTVNATLSMGKPADMVQIHVGGIQGSISDYTFGCSKIKPVACESVGTDGAITEHVLQAGARLSGVADNDGAIFAGRLVYPGTAKDYKFTLASNDKIYTLIRANKALTAGKMYNFPAVSETGGTNWAVQNASDLYVDLGLSVGGKTIYWAKCNLGATTETDYGDYFAWGETTGYNEGKTSFVRNTYVWLNDPYLTKYCTDALYGNVDDLTTLEKEDDAAYAALGGKFRLPTLAEMDALLSLTKEWVTDYNGSGINGCKFTGNGNTLFLPAAGDRNYTTLYNAGYNGQYWSSSLSTGGPDSAYRLYFYSDSFGNYFRRGSYFRYFGFSVRPVSE